MSNEYPPTGGTPQQPEGNGAPGDLPSYNPGAGDPTGAAGPGYPPPPPPMAPGGYPMGPGMQPQKTNPLAIVSLVTALLGIPCCGFILLGAVGAVTGFLARKQIAESGGMEKGDGMAKAGMIIGAIMVVLGIVYWVLVLAGVATGNFNIESNS